MSISTPVTSIPILWSNVLLSPSHEVCWSLWTCRDRLAHLMTQIYDGWSDDFHRLDMNPLVQGTTKSFFNLLHYFMVAQLDVRRREIDWCASLPYLAFNPFLRFLRLRNQGLCKTCQKHRANSVFLRMLHHAKTSRGATLSL